MDSNLFDRDDEIVGSSSRKCKRPKKFFNDCDGVDQASVPRKLRSAMKKRNGDSPSPSPSPQDSKKVKATIRSIESLKNEDVKKSKLRMKRRSLEEKPRGLLDSEQITKDEEEVVETLYALAGMFPTNDVNLETKGSPTFECQEDSPIKDEFQPNLPPIEAAKIQSALGKETVTILSLNQTQFQEQSGIGNTSESVCEIKLQNSDTTFDLRHCTLHKQPDTCSSMRKPVILPMQEVMPIGGLLEEQKINNEKKKNSPVLWPGLSPPLSHDAGGSNQSKLDVNAPHQLDPTSFIGSQFGKTVENCSNGKVSKIKGDGKSWKNCAAHIHISRLVSTLQESKDGAPEFLKQGSAMAAKRVNEFASENSMTGKYSKDSIHGIPQLNQDPLQKQSFDFLSLSTKVGGLEASNRHSNKSGTTLEPEPMTQLHVPHLHSAGKQPQPPFSLLHAHHFPGDFSDHPSLSSAMPQQAKLPSSTASTKGQQWLWASNGETPCWLNGRNFYISSYGPSTISGNSFL